MNLRFSLRPVSAILAAALLLDPTGAGAISASRGFSSLNSAHPTSQIQVLYEQEAITAGLAQGWTTFTHLPSILLRKIEGARHARRSRRNSPLPQLIKEAVKRPDLQTIWKDLSQEQLMYWAMATELVELTERYKLAWNFPKEDIALLTSVIGTAHTPLAVRYLLGCVTAQIEHPNRYVQDYAIFNLAALYTMEKLDQRPSPTLYLPTEEAFTSEGSRATLVLYRKDPDREAFLDSLLTGSRLSNEFVTHLRATLSLFDFSRVNPEDINRERYPTATHPSLVVVDPSYRHLFPHEFFQNPVHYWKTHGIEYHPAFFASPFLIKATASDNFGKPFSALEDMEKVGRFLLPDGHSWVYIKRLDALRTRTPEEEAEIAARVHTALQKLPPEKDVDFGTHQFIAFVYSEGSFYLLTLQVEQNSPANSNDPHIQGVQNVLEQEGVVDAKEPARLKDILVYRTADGKSHYRVLDFESYPFRGMGKAPPLRTFLSLITARSAPSAHYTAKNTFDIQTLTPQLYARFRHLLEQKQLPRTWNDVELNELLRRPGTISWLQYPGPITPEVITEAYDGARHTELEPLSPTDFSELLNTVRYLATLQNLNPECFGAPDQDPPEWVYDYLRALCSDDWMWSKIAYHSILNAQLFHQVAWERREEWQFADDHPKMRAIQARVQQSAPWYEAQYALNHGLWTVEDLLLKPIEITHLDPRLLKTLHGHDIDTVGQLVVAEKSRQLLQYPDIRPPMLRIIHAALVDLQVLRDLNGRMKAIERWRPTREEAEQPHWIERHAEFEKLAKKVKKRNVYGVQAKVVYADLGPLEGGYHFLTASGVQIIVINSQLLGFLQEEALFHEGHELLWMSRGFSQREAHIIAWTQAVLKFPRYNKSLLTPMQAYHLDHYQSAENGDKTLYDLILEDNAFRARHHRILDHANHWLKPSDKIKIPVVQTLENMFRWETAERLAKRGGKLAQAPRFKKNYAAELKELLNATTDLLEVTRTWTILDKKKWRLDTLAITFPTGESWLVEFSAKYPTESPVRGAERMEVIKGFNFPKQATSDALLDPQTVLPYVKGSSRAFPIAYTDPSILMEYLDPSGPYSANLLTVILQAFGFGPRIIQWSSLWTALEVLSGVFLLPQMGDFHTQLAWAGLYGLIHLPFILWTRSKRGLPLDGKGLLASLIPLGLLSLYPVASLPIFKNTLGILLVAAGHFLWDAYTIFGNSKIFRPRKLPFLGDRLKTWITAGIVFKTLWLTGSGMFALRGHWIISPQHFFTVTLSLIFGSTFYHTFFTPPQIQGSRPRHGRAVREAS